MIPDFIRVNLQDKESLKNAILAFSSQLRDAYKTGELINQVGGFVAEGDSTEECRCLDYSEAFDPVQFQDIILIQTNPAKWDARKSVEENCDDDFDPTEDEPHNEKQLEQLKQDGGYLWLTHILVFQHALQHEELKPLLVRLCEELVEFSTLVNSSNELFFHSHKMFGINLLVLLAEKYPEYAYMVGEYYPIDGDYDQVAEYSSSYIGYLFAKYGYSDLLLEVLANSRFKYLLGCVYNGFDRWYLGERFTPNLLLCFLKDKSRYQYFKNAVIESYKRRPMVIEAYAYDPFCLLEDGFDDLYRQYEVEDEEEDYDGEAHHYFTEDTIDDTFEEFIFHGRTIEEEREAFHQEIFDAIKHIPLKDFHHYPDAISDGDLTLADIKGDPFHEKYDGDKDNYYEVNRSFFLECFDNGEQIVAYIEKNQYPEILDQLEPTNLRRLAFENKHYIYRRFDYYGSGYMKLSTDLEQDILLSDIIDKFFVAYQNPDSFGYEEEDDGEAEQDQKCLRVLDVLMRLMGRIELSADELNIVTDFELCSKKEAIARFTIAEHSADEIREILYMLINTTISSGLSLSELEQIHGFYQRDPSILPTMLPHIIQRAFDDTDDDILAHMPEFNQTEYARPSQLLSVAYILSKEETGLFTNAQLEPLWAFYNDNIYKSLYRLMGFGKENFFDPSESDKRDELIGKIKQYIEEQGKGSGGFFARFKGKSDGADSQTISKEQALTYARELLVIRNSKNENEAEEEHYSLVGDRRFSSILGSMLYAAKVTKPNLRKQFLSFYELMLQLSPVGTMLASFEKFSPEDDCDDVTVEQVEAFCDVLDDLKIDEKYGFLLRIVLVHKANPFDDYLEEFDDEHGMKTLYENLLNIYRNKDNSDSGEPAMLARREKKITEALTSAVELLNNKHKSRFLGFVNP